jgi:hypothetical protein
LVLLADQGEQGLLQAEQDGAGAHRRVSVVLENLGHVEGQAKAESGVVAVVGARDRVGRCGAAHQATPAPCSRLGSE